MNKLLYLILNIGILKIITIICFYTNNYIASKSSLIKQKKRLRYLENKKYNYFNIFHFFMLGNIKFKKKIYRKKNKNFNIQKSVTIGICVRNCEIYLDKNLELLDKICNLFEFSNIIFYENNSTDNTLQILNNYSSKNNNCIIINEEIPLFCFPRTVRLARGRNICLNIAKKIKNEIYIVLDFDDIILNFNLINIKNIFLKKIYWDAIFAHQNYDNWALRTFDNFLNYDCLLYLIITGKSFRNSLNIEKKNNLIPVKSAFGGFGIYKFNSIKNYKYYGWKHHRECCEHVHLHKQMVNNNCKLFIANIFC